MSLFRDELTQQRDGLQLDLADIKVKFEVKKTLKTQSKSSFISVAFLFKSSLEYYYFI